MAALRQGIPVGGSFDVLFGGGAYEYEQLSKPITVDSDGASRSATVLEPIGFDEDWLRDAYGDGLIGGRRLFDAGGHWFGAALSDGWIWARRPAPLGPGWPAQPLHRGAAAAIHGDRRDHAA